MIILAAFLIILPFVTTAGIVLALGALLALWIYGVYERYTGKGQGGGEEVVVCEEIPSACESCETYRIAQSRLLTSIE
ncbi:MAG: hypothetical protein M1548_03185 [Actinobacteria bacterium]|nr:hypothetical protein [Actinomycetota bacterium]